jgi:hypothetical protein
MPTRSGVPSLGQEGPQKPDHKDEWPHEIAGVHGHAGYASVEDLDARLAAARGDTPTHQAAPPGPPPVDQ